jgi:hypothetical protein
MFFAKCHSAECHSTKCHYAECHSTKCHYAKCHSAECHFTKCHYAECRSAECYSAKYQGGFLFITNKRCPLPVRHCVFGELKINLVLVGQ